MLAKNNKQEQLRQSAMKDKRFGLKKLSVGLASVALGTILFLGQANAVSAAELGEGVEATTAVQAGEEVQEPTVETEEMNTPAVESSVVETPEVTGTPEQQDPAEVPEEQYQTGIDNKVSTEINIDQSAETNGAITELKTGAKHYIEQAYVKDLTKEQRTKYGTAIDNISSGADIEQKIENILHLANAEALVGKVESGKVQHIKHAKEALKTAKAVIAKGTSVDGVDKLLQDLQGRLDTVIEKHKSPAEKAKDGAKAYLNRAYIGNLENDQLTKYHNAIDKISNHDADYTKKIEDIFQVVGAEVLVKKVEKGQHQHVNRAKTAIQTAKQVVANGQIIEGAADLLQGLEHRLTKVIDAQLPHKQLIETELTTNPNNSWSEAQESTAKSLTFDVIVADYKEEAKSHISHAYNDQDLSKDRYKAAIDKISNDDPDYEQKIEDIMKVATAEILVKQAEAGRHVEDAKNALNEAGKETSGGKLIDGKDELISSLQGRLNRFTKQDEYDALRLKSEKLTQELFALKQKVDEAEDGEVDQEVLEAIQEKVYELKETLYAFQEHIANLPEEEVQEAVTLLEEQLALLDQIEEKYSFEEATPAEEAKEETKDYINKAFGTDLDENRREAYKKAIDQISDEDEDYDQKIQAIVKVVIAEALVNKVEKGAKQHTNRAIQALEEAKNNTTGSLVDNKDQLLQRLQQRLDAVTGKHMDKKQPSVKNSQEAFGNKRKEIVEATEKWGELHKKLNKNEKGRSVATQEQQNEIIKLSKEIKKLISEWEELAKGNQKNQDAVQAFKDIVKNNYDKIPGIK
ncbi:YSIRK-type signal peptide-containing protein [Dolosigranulum pigrum]|uniref:YSIRK-type signal peptide-containing protein n=1 Tax=Dolosigranulum pigrum TaxID=29394 RepID=UPI00248B5C03|nr:YSIRK-type signal peptide-containing protein [Dolosigranulum pigrum]